ncbi:hypothetical protein NLU13_3418 [Sarocladium strictum]|uniref:Carrier domain-containing protein n=1 Tax=Sarocladium strictum TaxID=5046 RepID=A0AA39GLZ6_SARSR|nr:hypothetical protein NLU13_3418 [Sarocladium strictum]
MRTEPTASCSEAQGQACPTEPCIWDRLLRSASSFPERLAVACLHQPSSLYRIAVPAAAADAAGAGAGADDNDKDYLRWTYSDLKIAVDRLADSLLRLGVGRGDVLASCLDNGIEFVMVYWAAHKLGCPFVPINPKTLVNRDEAAHMLNVAKVSAVVVGSEKHGRLIDEMNEGRGFIVKVVVSERPSDSSWVPFSSMLQPPQSLEMENSVKSTLEPHEEVVTVLFTSGTTSKPKGVPHTSTTLNAFCQNLSPKTTSHKNVFCSVLPNNHAMGYFFPLHYMMHGAAVVYPSAGFDATKMAEALQLEKVTHTAIVASALHSLLEAVEYLESDFTSSLEDVCLSGSSVTPANIRHVFGKLGSKGASTGFGMTEGSPIWCTSKKTPEELIIGESTNAGVISPGAHVRLCAPGSRDAVPRGQPGEIHQTGPGVIKSYLGMSGGSEDFYTDDCGRVWFVTGDQAVMHPDGRFSVTGRYKEMIIRGGENISPAAIEATMYRYCHVQGYIVGAPDPIAGEVPVLVLKETTREMEEKIRDTIVCRLGTAFVPERMLSLSQLGLTEVPRTSSMKVQKSKLAAIVRDYIRSSEETSEESPDYHSGTSADDSSAESVKHQVLKAYFKATGMPIDKLDTNLDIAQFADSIALMRVRDYLRKNLGQALSIKEMTDNSTLQSQIDLLGSRVSKQQPATQKRSAVAGKTQAPGPEELEVLLGGPEEAQSMRLKMSGTLEARGLSWSQVSSVIPAYDYMQALLESEIIDTWNFAIAVTTQCRDVSVLRQRLKATLALHPVLTSFVVLDQGRKPYYLTVDPNDTLWNLCIFDHGPVDTVADLQQLAVDFPRTDLARMPGPLFTCHLVQVKESNSSAMIIYLHHIVQDATSLRLFLEDLNHSLQTPAPQDLKPHTGFKAWADSYQALRNSPEATASVKFHVARLRHLHQHTDALYPQAKVPRQAIAESPDGLDHGFDAPDLIELRSKHPAISAPIVLKAAMALVNVSRTGHDYSAFFNFEAGRAGFPFVPASVRSLRPEAFESSDVNGPTMQAVCNLIKVPREESALDFLNRVAEEQLDLTKHAHAPIQRIIDGLEEEAQGAGQLFMEVHRTQFTTWVPGLLGEYERLQVAKIAIRCAAGLVVVAGLGGPQATTYGLSLRWDVANYSREQSAEFVNDLQEAVLWLIAEENRDRPLADFVPAVVV